MKKNGFSTIELLVSFVIVSLIAIAMFSTVVDLLDRIDTYQNSTKLSILNGTIKNYIEEDFNSKKLYGIKACGCNCYDFVFQDLSAKRLTVDPSKNTIKYDMNSSKIPDSYLVKGINVSKAKFNSTEGKYDSIIRISVPIVEKSTETSVDMNIVYQYDSRDRGALQEFPDKVTRPDGYSCTLGYNTPILAPGMTPIKWNGVSWVDTNVDDEDWYNYDAINKKWANAQTADGSMWVWIPRYVYRISSGWHTNTAGTIDIQWSMGTDDTRGGTITLDAGTGASASNNKWTNHPGFNFGTDKLTGIWVAKFEATAAEGVANGYTSDGSCPTVGDNVTTKAIKIIPNVSSWRCVQVGNTFTNTRNMETNSIYGWGTSGIGIDTHLMKNNEWGSIAYLSKSTYGQGNNEIWINPANDYTTGCAGDSATSASTTGCLRTYETTNGQKASTTANIYGIYDISGGAFEYESSYVDNGNSSLDQGLSITGAASKYKNVYTVGGTDDQATNYNLTSNFKGDTIYETTNNVNGFYSWFSDYSYMPNTSVPWFIRGGRFSTGSNAGAFGFTYSSGGANSTYGFRPVIAMIDEPPTVTVISDNPKTIMAGSTYTDAGALATDLRDGDISNKLQITSNVNTNTVGTYTVTYSVTDSSGNITTASRTVNVIAIPANYPVLATGMTPIKWDGSAWVDTTASDSAWYNYSTTDKKWANARTADGSMWVWIPRYIYKISSGWHTTTAGTIDIQWSLGTDDTRGGSVTIDTGTTSNASNNKWTNHPAFTFGTTELTGIWVAKFEATAAEGVANGYTADGTCPTAGDNVTTKTVKIVPNVASWRCIQIGNTFTVSRNMETNSAYGWGTTGTGIDTHMMKNTERGVVAYLSNSVYGKNSEVWINNSQTYTTGCAGNSVSEGTYNGCQNTYNTTTGVNASTTGNIYGIYDMNGGTWEYTSAYVNNGNAALTGNGASIISASSQYKDSYTMGSSDTQLDNYPLTINKKGDTIYETGNPIPASTYINTNSWYSDFSNIPYGGNPWFSLGGKFNATLNAGVFSYSSWTGAADNRFTFRPVIAVSTGL